MIDAHSDPDDKRGGGIERISLTHRAVLATVLFIAAFTPLAIPYIQPGHQVAHDRLVPFMRVDALQRAMQEPQIPPRWFPEFDGGYGSPYPGFYAMLFYYPAAVLYTIGLPLGSTVELTAFITLVLSGVTMFLFVSRYWGSASGVLAAILYVYAPYHLADAFERGAYSELAAFIWPPLIALSFLACYETGQKRWIALGSLSIAALILTHNLMSIMFLPSLIPLVIVWAIGHGVHLSADKRRLRNIALASALGLSLSAFFWIPIALERRFVQLDYFLKFDYRGDFVPVRQLIKLPEGTQVATSVGILLAVLPILAVVLAFAHRPSREQIALLFAVLALASFNLFMATRFSSLIWRLVGPLEFVQFPWRFLSVASFYLAVGAGPAAFLSGGPRRAWSLTLGLSLIAIYMFAPLAQIKRKATINSINHEQLCREVWGTQDYRPAWSKVPFWDGVEPPEDPLAGPVLPPCPGGALRSSADNVEVLEVHKNGSEWTVRYQASESTPATLSQYYYPGQEVRIDGVPITIRPTSPEGLISLTLPQGTHIVNLSFGDTPIRLAANLVSFVGLALTLWLLIPRQTDQSPPPGIGDKRKTKGRI